MRRLALFMSTLLAATALYIAWVSMLGLAITHLPRNGFRDFVGAIWAWSSPLLLGWLVWLVLAVGSYLLIKRILFPGTHSTPEKGK